MLLFATDVWIFGGSALAEVTTGVSWVPSSSVMTSLWPSPLRICATKESTKFDLCRTQ